MKDSLKDENDKIRWHFARSATLKRNNKNNRYTTSAKRECKYIDERKGHRSGGCGGKSWQAYNMTAKNAWTKGQWGSQWLTPKDLLYSCTSG